MSVTIFCNFEQQDLADLAMGKLRASTKGIQTIHYINTNRHASTVNATNTISPSSPVTVKIVCTDNTANTVVARLVNLHAYQIITTR